MTSKLPKKKCEVRRVKGEKAVSNFTPQTSNFSSRLPINIKDLLHQRRVEGERIEYKAGWNPDAEPRILRCVRFKDMVHETG